MPVAPLIKILYAPTATTLCLDRYKIGEHNEACITHSGEYIIADILPRNESYENLLKKAENLIKNILSSDEKNLETIIDKADSSIQYFLKRQLFGYGVLEPLFLDEDVIDIHVLKDKPVKITHRKHGDLIASISLSEDEMREFVMRASSLAGKIISEANPLASFIEPRYETRVSVVYLSDVTLRRSMTIDIRKQPKKPWSVLKLVNLGTLTIEEVAFLWLALKYKVPIMIVGEMMSGKTTLATAILNLIPPKSKIITIEDAPEIRLCTPYWTRTTTRDSPENPITVFNLLKIALRLSVDYVVVGEVRGEEARDWAQAILLGHGAVTTFHADSPESALLRLTTPPINVNPQALRLLNVFLKTIPLRKGEKLIRRTEIYIYDQTRNSSEHSLTPLFKYNPDRDEVALNPSIGDFFSYFSFFNRISLAHGVTLDAIRKEYDAMVRLVREEYEENKRRDSSLSDVDICDLAHRLYVKLAQQGLER